MLRFNDRIKEISIGLIIKACKDLHYSTVKVNN